GHDSVWVESRNVLMKTSEDRALSWESESTAKPYVYPTRARRRIVLPGAPRDLRDKGRCRATRGRGSVRPGEDEWLDQTSASPLATRLERLRNTLRPTPHVQLAMKEMDLFAKLEYMNPVGSIKDRVAYWILTRAAERGEIGEETTVIESSSGNFAV